ncbi:unnamed protein product, partial [Prorocentrum cordatum]
GSEGRTGNHPLLPIITSFCESKHFVFRAAAPMRWPLLAAACALAAIPTLTAGLQQVQERAPKRKALEKKSRNAPKRKALEKKGLRHREKNVRHRHKKALHKAPAVASHGAAGLVDQEGV